MSAFNRPRGMAPEACLRLRGRPRAWALFTLICFGSSLVRAESADPTREQARQLAARGFDALQHKDYAAAEDYFRRADELVHAPTLVVDHARALVGLGQLVEAHEGFELVLREGVSANAPWQWKQALSVAQAELAAVEPRLAWLTVRVEGPETPSVQIDDKPLPNAALGVKRATNPGVRVISVRADRFLPMEKFVTLKEGQVEVVDFKLEPDPNAPPLEVTAPPPPVVVVVAAPPPPKPPDRTLATVLLSAGGAAIAAGAVTGFLALRVRSDLNQTCAAGVCSANTDSEYADLRQKVDRYRGLGTASGVAFAVGVGAALTGIGLFVFTTDHRQGESGKLQAAPANGKRASLKVGPGSLELSGNF